MKDRLLVAKRDKSGSEGTKFNRYTFGNSETSINGGLYVDKSIELPDRVVILFAKENEEVCNVSIS